MHLQHTTIIALWHKPRKPDGTGNLFVCKEKSDQSAETQGLPELARHKVASCWDILYRLKSRALPIHTYISQLLCGVCYLQSPYCSMFLAIPALCHFTVLFLNLNVRVSSMMISLITTVVLHRLHLIFHHSNPQPGDLTSTVFFFFPTSLLC